MGCAIVVGKRNIKSKTFEYSAVEEAAEARGISIEKVYKLIPDLLDTRRRQQPINIVTQYELSTLLDFPLGFFYHRVVSDQRIKVFMCGEGIMPCAFCGHVADYYCDYPIGDGRTCDLPLCREHKKNRPDIGLDIDYCPHHSIKKI
jgi:hypothetical protein